MKTVLRLNRVYHEGKAITTDLFNEQSVAKLLLSQHAVVTKFFCDSEALDRPISTLPPSSMKHYKNADFCLFPLH